MTTEVGIFKVISQKLGTSAQNLKFTFQIYIIAVLQVVFNFTP